MLPKWIKPKPMGPDPYLAGMVEQVADSAYVREKSGQIVYANAALCALSGYTRAELGRMHMRELYVLDAAQSERILDLSNNTFLVRGEQQLKRKDGQLLPVEVCAGFIGGGRVGAVMRDLRKRSTWESGLHSAARLFVFMEGEIEDVLFSLAVEPGEQYRFRSANQAFYRAIGLEPREVIDQPVQAVIPQPALKLVLEHYRQAIREKRAVRWEETSEYPTGVKYGEVTVMPVFNTQGVCIELAGRVHDITERKQHEQAMERQRNMYAMLSQTNQAIVHIHNRDDLFLAICHAIVHHGRLKFAAISLLDPQTQRLRMAVKYGADDDYLQFALIFANPSDIRGRGPSGEAVTTGHYVVCNEFLNDPRTKPWHELALRCGIRASASFPLRTGGQIIGVLSLYSDIPNFFTEDMLPTVSEMAGDVSFALDNYVREADRTRLMRERDQIFSRVADGFLAVDRDWNLTYVNTKACEILGGDPAALLGKNVWSVMPREIVGQLLQPMQISMLQQQAAVLEEYFEFREKWYAVNSYPSADGLTVYFRDITARKLGEEQERAHRAEMERISHRVLEVQESERRNLARELHDEVGQCLSVINMKLREADTLTTKAPLKRLLKEASTTVTELDEQIGQMSLDLHPTVLDDLGLSAALRWCVRTRLGSDGRKVHLDVEPGLPRYPESAEQAVFRVFQESVTNALKYAQAAQINVKLAREAGDKLRLTVADNGRGFDVAAALQAARSGKSLGLLGMQERARFLGGEVAIDSHPGQGTTVQLVLSGHERLKPE